MEKIKKIIHKIFWHPKKYIGVMGDGETGNEIKFCTLCEKAIK